MSTTEYYEKDPRRQNNNKKNVDQFLYRCFPSESLRYPKWSQIPSTLWKQGWTLGTTMISNPSSWFEKYLLWDAIVNPESHGWNLCSFLMRYLNEFLMKNHYPIVKATNLFSIHIEERMWIGNILFGPPRAIECLSWGFTQNVCVKDGTAIDWTMDARSNWAIFLENSSIKTRNRLKVFLGWKTNVVNRYQSKKYSHESFCFFQSWTVLFYDCLFFSNILIDTLCFNEQESETWMKCWGGNDGHWIRSFRCQFHFSLDFFLLLLYLSS